jgi:hypothetical protein
MALEVRTKSSAYMRALSWNAPIREAGLLLMMGVMEEEVRHVVGERSVPNADRQASRWGKERAYCVVDGQKVPLQRTRVRDRRIAK